MKFALIFLLCLAYISVASCQHEMTAAFIEGRAAIVEKNHQWYQKIDASYLRVYKNFMKKLDEKFEPLNQALETLRTAYEEFPKEDLSDETAERLNTFFTRVSQSLDETTTNYNSRFLIQDYFGVPTEMTPVTLVLKNSLMTPMTSIFNYLTSRFVPVGETCVTQILSKFVPTYEPYAKELLLSADKAIEAFPASLIGVTSNVQIAVMEVRLFKNRINICAASTDRDSCIHLMLNEYGCNDPSCMFELTLSKPFMSVYNDVSEAILYYIQSRHLLNWSLNYDDEMEALKAIC